MAETMITLIDSYKMTREMALELMQLIEQEFELLKASSQIDITSGSGLLNSFSIDDKNRK